jgi:hypothetical protein
MAFERKRRIKSTIVLAQQAIPASVFVIVEESARKPLGQKQSSNISPRLITDYLPAAL